MHACMHTSVNVYTSACMHTSVNAYTYACMLCMHAC